MQVASIYGAAALLDIVPDRDPKIALEQIERICTILKERIIDRFCRKDFQDGVHKASVYFGGANND